MNFCAKSSGFANFENTVDRGSAVNFDADSGLCLRSWILNELWIIDLPSALVGMLISFSKLFLFFFKQLELICCVIVIKHVAFFSICAKCLVTMAFTFTFPDVIGV